MKLEQFYFTQKVIIKKPIGMKKTTQDKLLFTIPKNKKIHIKSQSYNLKQKLMTELRPLVQDKNFVIEIFGCSHCKSFIRNSINIGNVKIINRGVSSASMTGVTRDSSKLQYKNKVQNVINNYKKKQKKVYYIFKFGQVDIEYVYFYKTLIKKETLDKNTFYNSIIDKYIEFLLNIKRTNKIDIIICGSNLISPTNWKKYVKSILKLRSLPDDITYKSKQDDVLFFNELLMLKSRENNIKYFDTTNECSKNGILKKEFVGKDHHYRGAEIRDLSTYKDPYCGYHTHKTFLTKLLSVIDIN
jgi:hypothetical protein